MKVTLFDNTGLGEIPNSLKKKGQSNDYHVHAEGCGDCAKYLGKGWTFEAESTADVAEAIFSDIIEENGESPETYVGEFYFAPCTAALGKGA